MQDAAQVRVSVRFAAWVWGWRQVAGLLAGVAALMLGVSQAHAQSATLTTLASFLDTTTGALPKASLIQGSDGNFYGTTSYGGSDLDNCSYYCGTVFKLTPSGTLTTLVNFNGTNGGYSTAALIQASDGNFYGTTAGGGDLNCSFAPGGCGTVFKLTPSGTLTTLVQFNYTNGAFPCAGLIQGSDGNFYGTTEIGADSSGTVFKLTPSGTLTTLVSFNGTNGAEPVASLIQGSDGNFYGTTSGGGNYNNCYYNGCGTVFKLTPSGTLTTLVDFNGTNGESPLASLIQGSDGNFYGTTSYGGIVGYGTVFKLTPSGTLTTLVDFNGTSEAGAVPYASLIQGSDGNFYGTTEGGPDSQGTVFQLTPSGTLTTLVSFNYNDYYNGTNPEAGLIQGRDGNFYGTTYSGGPDVDGTAFKLEITYLPPLPPTGLTATAGDTQVTLSWTASSGASTYNVYEGTASGAESTTPVMTGLTDTGVTLTGLSNDVTYYFKVAAVNANGTSVLSNEARATPQIPPPTGLTATAKSRGKASLEWTASTDATSYNVYEGTAPGQESTTPIQTGLTKTKAKVKSLTDGQSYCFKVAGVNAGGVGTLSNEACITAK